MHEYVFKIIWFYDIRHLISQMGKLWNFHEDIVRRDKIRDSVFYFSLIRNRRYNRDFLARQFKHKSNTKWFLRWYNHSGKHTLLYICVYIFLSSLLIDLRAHNICNRSMWAAHAQMLLTDQSRLIELRLAVLRSANDRRDISAASGMFVRQCARVNEQREDGDDKRRGG